MPESFDPLSTIKRVLIMHLLRQQVEADLAQLQNTPLHLQRCYTDALDRIHAHLLAAISEQKRLLKRHGVRIIKQQKNSLDFHIAYLQRGYEVQHCFLLATLQAESQLLFTKYLEGEAYGDPR